MEKELEKIGFSASESKIYIELLKERNLLAGKISKRTGLNRRTVYDCLSRLEEKGIVANSLINNKKHFFPIDPEIIINKIEETKKTALNLLPMLKRISMSNTNESNVSLFKSKEGIMNILRMILKTKEYVSFGSGDQFMKVMDYYYFQFQNQKEKLKIKSKTILGSKLKKSEVLGSLSKTSKIRFLPDLLAGNSSTFIFNDKVAILIWEKPYWGILIESRAVSGSYFEYFEKLWKVSRKVCKMGSIIRPSFIDRPPSYNTSLKNQ
jgi:sugar-specific transcriptional regulator TrmB